MWKHHPIALYPTKEYDQNGCFSGTALIKDDELHLCCTGVTYDKHIAGNIQSRYDLDEGNIHSPYDSHSFEASQAR